MGRESASDSRRILCARLALLAALSLYASVAIVVVVAGPEEVVGHFGGGGQPTRMDPTGQFVLTMSLVVAGVVALFSATPALMRRIPIELVNVPNRDQWNTPERRVVLARRIGADMRLLSAATVLLLTATLVLSTVGGLGLALPGWVFPLLLGSFLAVIGVIVVRMYRRGRFPPTGSD